MQRIASLSLDLDNKWSYMKTRGDAGWESFPSYLDTIVPKALKFLDEFGLRITFFIVGQDAAISANRSALASIASAGHEIGNHSFRHEPWLHLYSRQEFVSEMDFAEEAIREATGVTPVGFRGPGYSVSPMVLEVLSERGYEYDCSSLPTYIAPLARAYYFLRSPELTDDEREKRRSLFGKFSDGFRSLKPHFVCDDSLLVEIPVTTFPFFKVPVHASYLIYLASYSRKAALAYWRSALTACRVTGVQPSLLLHPLDLLSGSDVPELSFFPGMQLSATHKITLLREIISVYCENFDVVTLREHADNFRESALIVEQRGELVS